MISGVTDASRLEPSEMMDDLRSSEKDRQNRAYESLLRAAEEPVEWGYEVWDELLGMLKNGDSRQRSIAAQVLCNLAKSDPDERILRDLGALLAVTRDERFVTARHCLQALWRVGVVGERQREALVAGLVHRFGECRGEKNCTLIRYDILAVLRRVYDATGDAALRSTAAGLMGIEEDAKYRKKYNTLWRK